MDTNRLKQYAPKARRDFIDAVTRRAAMFGLTAKGASPVQEEGELIIIEGQPYPKSIGVPREKLANRIEQQDFKQVMEAVAYTWFNRFVAIRFMELHGYLDHSFRVLSHPTGDGLPEILEHAQVVDLPGLDKERIVNLKMDGTRDEELYRDLLLAQCHALHKAMPFLFEPVDKETELLLPDNLLQTDSLIRDLVTDIPEEDWQEIEIIGWLYQFYISEKKDQVIGKVVKSEDIPAATQLFTPNWIVKYMVQNSLGAQWLATYPHSPLKGQMEYYIEPAAQTPEVKEQLAKLQREWLADKEIEQMKKGLVASGQWPESSLVTGHYSLSPEHLTLIDPACGSGHILVEAYELFKAIYLERGYRQRDLAKLILEKNLFGLDIDGRAAQLTGFALMMKGRADDRRLFERGVKLNVMALANSEEVVSGEWLVASGELVGSGQWSVVSGGEVNSGELANGVDELVTLFEHATTFGSLIQVPGELAGKLPALKQLSEATSQDLFVSDALKRLGPLVQQAEILAAQYDAVVANPPYIGSKFHIPLLKRYLKDNYKGYEKDVFSAFIDRDLAFSKPHGHLGFMSPFVWMFISSHEHLRTRLIDKETITSLVQLEYSGFEGATVPICTFTLQNGHVNRQKGCYVRLSDFRGSENQGLKTLEAIRNRNCGWFFEVAQDDFKKIPGSTLTYSVSDRVRNLFVEMPNIGQFGDARVGLQTDDNVRFLRQWFEVSYQWIEFNCRSTDDSSNNVKKWFPHKKGGGFRKWYGNNDYVVNWGENGKEIREKAKGAGGGRIVSVEFYFKPGITWSHTTSSLFSARDMGSGYIFNVEAPSLFGIEKEIYLPFLCSRVCLFLISLSNQTLHFVSSSVAALPFSEKAVEGIRQELRQLFEVCLSTAKIDWDSVETSWDFQSLPVLTASSEPTPTLESSYTAWTTHNRETIAEMKRLEEENNRLFIDAYGLADGLTPDVPIEQITLTVNPAYRYKLSGEWLVASDQQKEEELERRFREDTMAELVSYAIGCMMGRYRLDVPGLIYAHSGNERFWEIYDGVVSDEWRVASEELSGSDRVAEVDGVGGAGVQNDESLPERGNLRTQQSASQSSGVDTIQHSGRSGQKIHRGISELSLDSPGIKGGSGDPNPDSPTTGLRDTNSDQRDPIPTGRTLQNAEYTKEQATPLTHHSPLVTHHSYPPDADGIVPLTDTEWFDDDAAHRLIEFISVAWDAAQLEDNLTFLADNLSPRKSESSRETLRRYLCDHFFKDHLQTYKKRPIYWLFSSGKQKAFQCLVYLHRYNEGTLARMRMEYVAPLQGKMAARIDKHADDIQSASSSAQAKRLQKQRDKLTRQLDELRRYDEQLRHYADLRISLDLDNGVKVNYGKFGKLLAEVKAVTGKNPV